MANKLIQSAFIKKTKTVCHTTHCLTNHKQAPKEHFNLKNLIWRVIMESSSKNWYIAKNFLMKLLIF